MSCECVSFTFKCSDDSTFDLVFSKGIEIFNGESIYIGNIGSKNYRLLFSGSPNSEWCLIEEGDLSTIIYKTTTQPLSPCDTTIGDWELINNSNFNYCLDETEPPSEILNITEVYNCNPSADFYNCENCNCWFFSGSNDYTIEYYNCDNDLKYVRLKSGETMSFCLKGTPGIIPGTTSDFYSSETLNSCFIECREIDGCECLTLTLDGDDMGFVVGGTQNGKTFWTTNYDSDEYIIYWSEGKWLFAITPYDNYLPNTIIAESIDSGVCPPTGSSSDNWTIYESSYENFNITTYDCYPNFNIKKCWTITATTDNEIITFYDYLNTDEKKVFLYEGDVMEVCAFDKPVSSEPLTLITESDKSCSNICGSLNICGCIKVNILCGGEVPTLYAFSATPSGTINGYPLFINGITFFRFDDAWGFYNSNTFQIIAENRSKNNFCPFIGIWEINESFPCCIGPQNMTVLPKICEPVPTLTPTPTPTPIPYVIPTCNECIPTTVFTMEVECIPTNPTTITSSDGALSLSISGGTAPYEITWSNGNSGPDIFNLTEGSYTATTVDYYGDFTAVTICEITAPKPTTTTTTTTEPPITGETLCMTISTIQSTGTTTESITFEPDIIVNGKLSWVSLNGDTIIWNNSTSRWEVIFNPTRTYFVISLNPAFPPLNNWIVVGISGNVSVIEGECPITMMIKSEKKKNVSFKTLTNNNNFLL